MKNKWKNINLKIDTPIIFFGVFIVVCGFGFPEFSSQLNLFVLSATLAVLVYYAYDTHRIANQTVEGNLRPLILRSGFIESWDKLGFSINNSRLEGRPIEFSIEKNIAKDINGHIVINKKKYQLLFANQISSKNVKDNLSDVEQHILFELYKCYKTKHENKPQKIDSVYKHIGIKEGGYVGTVIDSKYIQTLSDEFLLTPEGVRLMDSDKPTEYMYMTSWGWMNKGTVINAIFTIGQFEESSEENNIYLTYCDMEGNKYFTKENENFSQTSGKL